MYILGRNNNDGGQNSNEGINATPHPPPPPPPSLDAYGFLCRVGRWGKRGGAKHVAVAVEYSRERYRRLPGPQAAVDVHTALARSTFSMATTTLRTRIAAGWQADANREMFPRSCLPTFSSSFFSTHFPGRSSLSSTTAADTLFDRGFSVFSFFF